MKQQHHSSLFRLQLRLKRQLQNLKPEEKQHLRQKRNLQMN
jgi:hypothetical protein